MSLSNKIFDSSIQYAYSTKLHSLIGVDEVERGLECKCICPDCGMRLISRKGDKNRHHFAHYEYAENPCHYSFWVSIRDMATQIIRGLKYIKIDVNMIKYSKVPFKNTSSFIYLQKEIKPRKKNGMDLFFETNIGRVSIVFLTEEEERKDYTEIEYFSEHIALKIDIKKTVKHFQYTQKALKEIALANIAIYKFKANKKKKKKHIENILEEFYTKHNRLYQSKSIMNMNEFKSFNIKPILINSFCQQDFSAINVAKVYYETLHKLFNDTLKTASYKILHEDSLHKFIVYNSVFYGVILVRYKYFIYQVFEDKIILFESWLDFHQIQLKIVGTNSLKSDKDKGDKDKLVQKEYPTLF